MISRSRSGFGRVLTVVLASAAAAVSLVAQAPVVSTVALIVTGGTVVTVDSARRVLSPGAIAINEGKIVAVDRPEAVLSRFRATQTIDASGEVVMPGLVNTHTHAPMVMYRGLADDLALSEWLERYIFPAEAKTVSPELVRAGTRLAALEMIQSGTTTYADMYYFEDEIARVTKAAGLRGVLGETIIGFPSPDAKTPEEALRRAEALIKEFSNDELIVPAVAPHSMYTVDAKSLVASRALATRYGVPVMIHVGETRDEVETSVERYGMPPVEYLESIGFWGPRTVLAHGVWLTDRAVGILLQRHVGVSHNPESNMKLASGVAPVADYRAEGLIVGLGTDGAASNNDLDMFGAMRQAAFLQKVWRGDPRALAASEVVDMATIDGARVLGLADHIGSIEPGKRADLITVSMKGARQTPMYNPVSHLVYVARGADVQDTIVNGRILMRDRKALTLDETAVLAEARRMADLVREAVK